MYRTKLVKAMTWIVNRITWTNFYRLIAVVALLISLYSDVYLPWNELRPELEFFNTPHYIGNNTAVNSILIRNIGDGAATNIGIFLELKRPYTIKEIRSNLEYNLAEGGVGYWSVKMTWDKLEPKNELTVAIIIEADPYDITSMIPVLLRVWSDTGFLEEQGIS